MHEHPPKSKDQKELYFELTRPDGGYVAITKEDWDRESEAQRQWYRSDPENRRLHPEEKPAMTSWDYVIMATLDGVEYWLPNDEEWFHIVAVDHTHRVARETGFCEMNDFTYEDSDYRNVVDPADGQLKCKFEFN